MAFKPHCLTKNCELKAIADDFCKVFDAQMEKYTIKSNLKRKYHRDILFDGFELRTVADGLLYQIRAEPLVAGVLAAEAKEWNVR